MARLVGMALIGLLFVAGGASAQTPAAPRRLELSFDDVGLVRLVAQNVTLREILAEWARQCGCYVVNGNQLSGAPLAIPLEFIGVPQATVLQSLLRQVPGYVLTPRRELSKGPSTFETIYVLASSSASAAAASAAASSAPVSFSATPLTTRGSPDDEIPPITPPQPVDPNKPISPPGTGTAPGMAPGSSAPAPPPKPAGVSVPAVRIVPVTPH